MKNYVGFFVFSVLILSTACSSKKVVKLGENKATKNGISLSADRVNASKKKYGLNLTIRNDSEKTVVIKLKKAQCFKGDVPGDLKRAFYNIGAKTFIFEPHQARSYKLVCEHEENAKGDFKIVFPYTLDATDTGEDSDKSKLSMIEWKHAEE